MGYAYATIGYRLLPDTTVDGQLGDVAQAIARLRRQKGVDAKRIVLIGHSSGATMAAQLGTDPAWLTKAGVPFGAIKAVVLLEPSVLDIPALLAERDNPGVEKFFRRAFGDDVAYQTKLSPVAQAGGPDVPHWLMVTDRNNGFSNAESAALVTALRGTDAAIVPVAGTDHLKLNREIGAAGDAATAAIDAFLARVLPYPSVSG